MKKFAEVLHAKLNELIFARGPQLDVRGDVEDNIDEVTRRQQEYLQVQWANVNQALTYEVKDALLRLRKGTYGICEGCRTRVSPRRLQALPWARYCLSCQEKIHG